MYPAEVDHALSLPPDDAVNALLHISESQWFERKSGVIKPEDLAIPLVAMANAEGGVVVVGLHGGAVVPVSDRAANDLRQVALDFTRPPVRIAVEELATASGRVLVFRVAPGDLVHETNKGEAYQRLGDESRRLAYNERMELEWDRGPSTYDGTVAPISSIDALDDELLERYRVALGSASTELMLRARDLLTVGGDVTVAGYLLFAKRPQASFPNAHVRVLKYADTERGVGRSLNLVEGADVRCEGSIPEQITKAQAVIEEFLPQRRSLGAQGKFEATPIIPRDAWLEGLVNAVIHRSYSIGGDHIRVEIFPNRLEITSPGRFPGIVDPTDPQSISRNARNPRIARVCADLGLAQELGEGIRRIFHEMRSMGLIDPLYQQTNDAVRLTLSASDAIPLAVRKSVGGGALDILDVMRMAQRPLGTGPIAELAGITRPTALRHLAKLRDAGLVVWRGQSQKDPRATWEVA